MNPTPKEIRSITIRKNTAFIIKVPTWEEEQNNNMHTRELMAAV
jgi:hypothetical protein